MGLLLVLAALGALAGFLSGLLGIGGGIVMAPLLLFVPPALGLDALDMRTVAGLTIVQSLVGCIAGALSHRQFRFVSTPLAWTMGVSIFLAAAVGGLASAWVSSEHLLMVFASLALVAAVGMLMRRRGDVDDPDVASLQFSRSRAISVASGVGLLGGMVGQGGSFLLIPLMTAVLGVPTRIAIGTNLVIVAASSTAGMLGKAATGQISWWLTVPIVLSVVPAARVGSLVSRRVPVAGLRLTLAVLVSLAAVRMWVLALA